MSAGSPFIGSVSLFEVQLKIREAHLPNMGHARAAQHASPAATPRPHPQIFSCHKNWNKVFSGSVKSRINRYPWSWQKMKNSIFFSHLHIFCHLMYLSVWKDPVRNLSYPEMSRGQFCWPINERCGDAPGGWACNATQDIRFFTNIRYLTHDDK